MKMKKISILIILLAIISSTIFTLFAFNVFGATDNVSVQMYNSVNSASTNSICPKIKLTNEGNTSINLSEISMQYYYTIDGEIDQNFWCDHGAFVSPSYKNITSSVIGNFVKMDNTTSSSDYYLNISFNSGAGVLESGSSIELQIRFAKSNWTNYNQSNDYSFNSGSGFSVWDKITVNLSGSLIYGVSPDGSIVITNSVPTPTAVVTTNTITTQIPTSTPTQTITPTSTPTIAPTTTQSNKYTKIACVGDSITAGYNATSYTVYLAQLLGSNYEVINYGISGTTLLKNGDNPYWNQGSFTSSQQSLPDVVLIMLGTNDSKPYNWLNKSQFVGDYVEMINIYKNLSSSPTVYVMTSPTVFNDGQWGITNEIVTGEVVPLTIQAANQTNCQIIDINTATKSIPQYFPDNIHPNNQGSEYIAQTIYNAVFN